MSLAAAIARIDEIQSAFEPDPIAPTSAITGGAQAPAALTATTASASQFSNVLSGALSNTAPANGAFAPTSLSAGPGYGFAPGLGSTPALTSTPGLSTPPSLGATPGIPGVVPGAATMPLAPGVSPSAQRMVQLAEGEVGQAEQPPGSNDSPRIAMYRQATGGSGVGPWCAYFVSWAAQQAGTPLGNQGQGFGSVDQLYAWAQSTGRAVPNGEGYVPRPGDLIVWDEHIGMVEGVLPDGRVQTIEGNSSDRVSRNVHDASSALGYVRMS
ncbi:MAG TPA: CHAP domain-containing protein [Conexibacter sp.]|jgi:hypothetical protein